MTKSSSKAQGSTPGAARPVHRPNKRQIEGLRRCFGAGKLTRIPGGMWRAQNCQMRSAVKGDARDARHAGKHGDLAVPEWYLEDKEVDAMVAAERLTKHGNVSRDSRTTPPTVTVTTASRRELSWARVDAPNVTARRAPTAKTMAMGALKSADFHVGETVFGAMVASTAGCAPRVMMRGWVHTVGWHHVNVRFNDGGAHNFLPAEVHRAARVEGARVRFLADHLLAHEASAIGVVGRLHGRARRRRAERRDAELELSSRVVEAETQVASVYAMLADVIGRVEDIVESIEGSLNDRKGPR